MGQTGWGLERLGWGRAYAPGSAVKSEKKKPGKIQSESAEFAEEIGGGWGRDRTADTAIFSRMLYQLSYPAAPKSANQTR